MSPSADPSSGPPTTRHDPVVETHHGTAIADPYRWLEGDDEAVWEWTKQQNEYADALLDTPVRETVKAKMENRGSVPEYGAVTVEGGRYFQIVEEANADHGRLVVRESPDDDGVTLVNPDEWPPNEDDDESAATQSLRWFLPSDDGEHVAYGVTEGGGESVDIHVVSVPDGEEVAVLEDRGRVFLGVIGFDAVSPGMVSWDAEGEGLYYVATGTAEAETQMEKELRHWRFDDGEETLLEHDDERVWPTVRTERGGTVAVGFHDGNNTDWYVLSDEDETESGDENSGLRPVITDNDAETFVVFHGDTAFILTNHDAPNKRILTCSLARFRRGNLALSDCETVVDERDALVQSFAVTPRHLIVQYLEDAHGHLTVFDHDGNRRRDLALPDFASISRLRANANAEELFYRVESFHRPPTLVRASPATGERDEIERVDIETPELVVRQEFVESSGNVDVPVFVCHRADLDRSGDNPALLYGYGGFRSNSTPNFDRFRLPFLADGGVYAQVCARGGQEYGEPWHEDGMLANKQHTFDDFVAAGEFLCAAGYTNPDHLAVAGRSNGGLSVGAVVTQRPDLWTAARCSVPLLDMLRFHRFLLGESWTTEYGHPDDPEAFEYIREYSPYHSVEEGVCYPAVLFTTGAADARVHPSHARKMTARLQSEANGGPFLLRTEMEGGHEGGTSASAVVEKRTDEWAFLYDQLEMGETEI